MKGIDVSEHQGNIDWDKVKAAGIQFAIIRIGYGQNAVDSKAIRNITECIRVGIPFGIYTYSYALNVNNAINEANLVIRTLAPYKDKVRFPVIIDMEDADHYKQKHGMPSNDTLVSICEKECLMFEEAGYYAAIYASKSWFDTKLKSSRLDRFDKWMAWWNSSASSKFSHDTYGIWQYTSSGKVNGISGNVDMNESFKDYPSIIGGGNVTPTPQPAQPSTPSNNGGKFKIGDAVIVNGSLYVNSNADNPAGHITNKTTKITRYAAGTKHPYNTTGDLGWMNESDIKLVESSNSTVKTYTVQSGDTLSGIASKFGIKDWHTLYNNNVDVIGKNPNLIRPGQVLKI